MMSQRKLNGWLGNYSSDILYCGKPTDKQFTIALEVGQIYAADLLYGFNFEIGFNPKKIRIDNKLIQNTLAEFFETSDATFHGEGYVRGYAVNLKNKVVYGDRPLMAFLGTFLSDCEDTAVIRVNWIEFTEEFKGTIDTLKSLSLSMKKNPLSTDNTQITFDSTSYNLSGKEFRLVKMNFKANSTKSYKNATLELVSDGNEKNFSYYYYADIDTNNAKIINKSQMGDTNLYFIESKNGFKSDVQFRFMVSPLKNENISNTLTARLKIQDECNCINKYLTGITKLNITRKDTISDVIEVKNEDLSIFNNKIELNQMISKISIYNINGILISEINTENMKSIDLAEFETGIYFIVYDKENRRNSRKILINKL